MEIDDVAYTFIVVYWQLYVAKVPHESRRESSVLIRRTIHVERPPATLRIIGDITTFGKLKKTHLPSVAFNVS